MFSHLADVNATDPWFFPTLAFVLGAMVGSFLNVCIYRIPAGKSIVMPGSHCACGKPIAWFDNIPILSWFILRGKARCCGRPYSIRYAFVEALTGGLFLACWLLKVPGPTFQGSAAVLLSLQVQVAACGFVLVSALVAATFIDLDHFIIPDCFTIGLGLVGVMLSTFVPALHGQVADSEHQLLANLLAGGDAILGMLIGAGLVVWIAVLAEAALKKEAMGFGDVKLVGAIGAFTGWQGAVFAVFGGAVVGTVWVLLAWLWQKISGKKSTLAPPAESSEGVPAELGFGAQVPFGPMLAVAGAAHFLWFHHWTADYVAHFAGIFTGQR
jgi:leader peptidase (prepilin peptidase)/N-methyltransferase